MTISISHLSAYAVYACSGVRSQSLSRTIVPNDFCFFARTSEENVPSFFALLSQSCSSAAAWVASRKEYSHFLLPVHFSLRKVMLEFVERMPVKVRGTVSAKLFGGNIHASPQNPPSLLPLNPYNVCYLTQRMVSYRRLGKKWYLCSVIQRGLCDEDTFRSEGEGLESAVVLLT